MSFRIVILIFINLSVAFPLSIDIQPCPLVPLSGRVHIYGSIDSISVQVNRVSHSSKKFKGLAPSRALWDKKYLVQVKVDSVKGTSKQVSAITIYPGEFYFKVSSDISNVSDSLKQQLENAMVFECDRHGNEFVLKKVYSKEWYENHFKRCSEEIRNPDDSFK